MEPHEFRTFKKEKPKKNKWIIVTNNINATNAHGEMSHVWLTTSWIKSSDPNHGTVTYDEADRKIIGLTHWKYA